MSYAFFGVAGLMILISIIGFQDSYASSIASSPLADKLKQQGANAQQISQYIKQISTCLLYTSDAADERSSVDLGGRRIIKKKKKKK